VILHATVSVDLDPVDLHLVGYGHEGLPADSLAYRTAVPRLLEAFARHGVLATFFVVGRDAESQADAIRAIARAGHEVASHSLSHPMAFESLTEARQREELAEARARLERVTGAPVFGFRSPNFDFGPRAASTLAETGHRYDASAYPTALLLAARVLLALKARDRGAVLRMRKWPWTWARLPHPLPAGSRVLAEFPVTVAGPLRMPVYHTLRYGQSDARFEATLDALVRAGVPLSYPLHAVDVLGLAEDGVDARLASHPGMAVPLAEKLALLDRTLAAIAARFECLPFRDRLGSVVEAERVPAEGMRAPVPA
jgi:peptidoglycan/xylan/chitin deacetylase (PgdA/CDA1 family)